MNESIVGKFKVPFLIHEENYELEEFSDALKVNSFGIYDQENACTH